MLSSVLSSPQAIAVNTISIPLVSTFILSPAADTPMTMRSLFDLSPNAGLH